MRELQGRVVDVRRWSINEYEGELLVEHDGFRHWYYTQLNPDEWPHGVVACSFELTVWDVSDGRSGASEYQRSCQQIRSLQALDDGRYELVGRLEPPDDSEDETLLLLDAGVRVEIRADELRKSGIDPAPGTWLCVRSGLMLDELKLSREHCAPAARGRAGRKWMLVAALERFFRPRSQRRALGRAGLTPSCPCSTWDEIHGFGGPGQAQRFERRLSGAGTPVPVTSPYAGSAFDERWVRCECGRIWRFVAPDPPFLGLWEPVR